ncbi:hypothetical protein G6F40_013467 [Rhizopus arrhizus]|nr:hypothetical protein G6F40_013467 [Rhizopus arrhizus]
MQGQCMLQQLPADAGATHVRVDEQCFHVAAVDQHEAQRAVLCISGDGHRCLRQEAGHFGIDGLAVFGADEGVGGVVGATPQVDEGGAVVGARGAQGGHGSPRCFGRMCSMQIPGNGCRRGFIHRCDGG